jgi:hypothetical protein
MYYKRKGDKKCQKKFAGIVMGQVKNQNMSNAAFAKALSAGNT